MSVRWFLGVLVCVVGVSFAYSLQHTENKNIEMILIDNFENQDAWTLKFSKYRSKNWAGESQKDYEESRSWMKVIDASQDTDADILPLGGHQTALFQNPGTSVLAVRGRWDFSEDNWMVLEPSSLRTSLGDTGRVLELIMFKESLIPKSGVWTKDKDPNFIWFPGKVREVSCFVWGSNTSHRLELHFLDYKGRLHVFDAGDFRFKGWKRVVVSIPSRVEQVNEYGIHRVHPLRFVRFKIIADPYEKSKYFHTYFDYFYAEVEVEENAFPGYSLQFTDTYWNGASTNSTK